MKITITQPVSIIGDRFPHRWYKEYISEIVPRNGDYIQDSIWEGDEYYKATEVIIYYERDECYVSVEKYQCEITKDNMDAFADMANSHEWKCSWRL